MKTCVFTIASRNYVAAARTLARSLRAADPGRDVVLILADAFEASDFSDDEPFEVVPVDRLGLPDFDLWRLKYTILEFNTSVKAQAFAHLFEQGYDQVVYLDPDIFCYRSLAPIFERLGQADIVLTPHLLSAGVAARRPSDVDILTSGAYNLGFLGLRRSDNTRAFLAWWGGHLFNDCVVDIAHGLFVDQKWIDLVPGQFERVEVLRDPGLNVAYWNIHERALAEGRSGPTVNGEPLVFFHFSGFSPLAPATMSKHPHDLDLADDPGVQRLHTAYGAALLASGYVACQARAYAFDRLPNGVKLPRVLRRAIRDLIGSGQRFPHPVREADAFCRYLIRPSVPTPGQPISRLQRTLLDLRPDLLAHFPTAATRHLPPEFEAWLATQGVAQEGLDSFFKALARLGEGGDPVEPVLIDLGTNPGLLRAFGGMLASQRTYDQFLAWADLFARREFDWTPEAMDRLRDLFAPLRRIFNLYFSSAELLQDFPDLGAPGDLAGFVAWLGQNFAAHDLEPEAVRLFALAARDQADWCADVAWFHNGAARAGGAGWPDFFRMIEPGQPHPRGAATARRLGALLSDGPPLEEQHQIWRGARRGLGAADRVDPVVLLAALPQVKPEQAEQVIALLGSSPRTVAVPGRLNLAGHLAAPTGMGEAARSLASSAEACGLEVTRQVLPTPVDDAEPGPSPFLFGTPLPNAALTLTVANADTVERARQLLPPHYWGERNIAYWAWESDRLPRRLGRAATHYDAIWTLSEACRAAIAPVVDAPVHVMPLTLDFAALAAAHPRRRLFDLPKDRLVFGFWFDNASVPERKNPFGLIEAFKRAFGEDPHAMLVLKMDELPRDARQAARLREAAGADNIRIIARRMPRPEALALMASIDVYCSLHRFEGFGLTCAEAMAMGKPVIATGHSGNLDFMTPDSSRLVSAEIRPTTRPYGPYPAGALWAEPDLDEAARFMQELTEPVLRERLGAAGREHVGRVLSEAVVAERMRTLIAAEG